jgi:hypothetical protein
MVVEKKAKRGRPRKTKVVKNTSVPSYKDTSRYQIIAIEKMLGSGDKGILVQARLLIPQELINEMLMDAVKSIK